MLGVPSAVDSEVEDENSPMLLTVESAGLNQQDRDGTGSRKACLNLPRQLGCCLWIILIGTSAAVGYVLTKQFQSPAAAAEAGIAAPALVRRSPTLTPPPAGPVSMSVEQLDAALLDAAETAPLPSGLRLYIIAVTGKMNWKRKAMKVEQLIMKRAGPQDRIAYVCRHECAAMGRRQLRHMIELPDVIDVANMSNGQYSVAKCWRKHERKPCGGYHISSFKYVWGLVQEVRRFLKAGVSPMPEYWLVKDDDTYVHIPNLMEAIKRSSGDEPMNPLVQRVSWAAKGGCNICGGAGWVLSGALAIELATKYGDRYMRFQIDKMENGVDFQYDLHVPTAVNWVAQSKLIHIWEMNPSSVLDKELCRYRNNAFHGQCYRTVECNCSSTKRPATWHMSLSFEQSLQRLKLIP